MAFHSGIFLIALLVLLSVCNTIAYRLGSHSSKLLIKSQPQSTSFSRLYSDNEPRKIKRGEDGDFFESEFDRKPLSERLPVALGFLGVVSLPFIVGLIYLYSNK